jgi:hypothetical protein
MIKSWAIDLQFGISLMWQLAFGITYEQPNVLLYLGPIELWVGRCRK